MILTGISGVVAALGGVVAIASTNRASDFNEGLISEDEFLSDISPYLLLQFLDGFGLLIATAVVSIIWMYRISANVRAYGRETFWAPLWAVFGWVLPPALFIIPTLMLRELWSASSPEEFHDPDGWKRQPENPLLWGWFLTFVVVPFVLLIVEFDSLGPGNFGNDTETFAQNLEDAGSVLLISGLVKLAAAIFWILFVRQLTRRHVKLTGEV